jgi:hypothetical protein
MAFSGAAPETTNGRLAMLGFIAAVGAELSSGEGVLRQWSEVSLPPACAAWAAQCAHLYAVTSRLPPGTALVTAACKELPYAPP